MGNGEDDQAGANRCAVWGLVGWTNRVVDCSQVRSRGRADCGLGNKMNDELQSGVGRRKSSGPGEMIFRDIRFDHLKKVDKYTLNVDPPMFFPNSTLDTL